VKCSGSYSCVGYHFPGRCGPCLRQYPQPEAEFFVHASHHSAPHFTVFLFDLIPVFSQRKGSISLYFANL
jgi:hypothetical protein